MLEPDSELAKPVIATGHSLWFKSFFGLYNSGDASPNALLAQNCKIANSQIVRFTFEHCSWRSARLVTEDDNDEHFRVMPGSIHEIVAVDPNADGHGEELQPWEGSFESKCILKLMQKYPKQNLQNPTMITAPEVDYEKKNK